MSLESDYLEAFEADVYDNLAYLYEHRFGARLPVRNVPNRYLA